MPGGRQQELIYLDHHATTPVDARVLEVMLPYFGKVFGNAGSDHAWGGEAASAVDRARAQVAAMIGAHPLEIVFTSGATESINLALKGLAQSPVQTRRQIITAQSEHAAVLDVCAYLAEQGFVVDTCAIDAQGALDLVHLASLLSSETLAVSLMYANNEIGTLHDVAAIGALCREVGAFFHCDASQAAGKEHIDVDAQHIDLLSISGHKMYAPKGVGALYIRRKHPRVRLTSVIHGGGQERGYRSGTLNVPGIVGLGEACALTEPAEERIFLAGLRDLFLESLGDLSFHINGTMERRLAGNLNLRFEGVRASDLLASLPELALSTASACSRVVREPSRTLRAIGLDSDQAAASLRIGLGRGNTAAEMVEAATRLRAAVLALQGLSSNKVCEL